MRTYTLTEGQRLADSDTLLRIERRLRRMDEAQCNGVMLGSSWEQSERLFARREARAMDEARAFLDGSGWMPYHQGDPRGCSLYIYRPMAVLEYWERFHPIGGRDRKPEHDTWTEGQKIAAGLYSGGYHSVGIAVYRRGRRDR